MIDADEAYMLAQDAVAAIEALEQRITRLETALNASVNEARYLAQRVERNDKALIAYAKGNMVGPSAAFTAAFEILDGGH